MSNSSVSYNDEEYLFLLRSGGALTSGRVTLAMSNAECHCSAKIHFADYHC